MSEPQQDNMRRLGIIDLMLVTTAVAFVFMLHGAVKSDTDFLPPDWLLYPFLFAGAMTLGLVLPAIYWIPVLYARTGKIFSHPGHWILGAQLFVATWAIGFYVVYAVGQSFSFDDARIFYPISNLIGGGFYSASMILSIIAAIMLKEIRWKVASILVAGSFAAEGFGLAFQGITMLDSLGFSLYQWYWIIDIFKYIAMAIASLGIIVAVLVDWTSDVSRDWLHRVGLISKLASLTVMPLLQFLVVRYITMQHQ